jgi:flagellar FliJ protein
MQRSQRLKPVTQVAEARERQAAQALGLAQARLRQQEERLTELLTYKDEYHRRLAEPAGAGIGSVQLADYHQFLARLAEAISFQGQRIEEQRRQLEQARGRWVATRQKSEVLDKVVDRYESQEAAEAEKREQKALDDRAPRRGDFT